MFSFRFYNQSADPTPGKNKQTIQPGSSFAGWVMQAILLAYALCAIMPCSSVWTNYGPNRPLRSIPWASTFLKSRDRKNWKYDQSCAQNIWSGPFIVSGDHMESFEEDQCDRVPINAGGTSPSLFDSRYLGICVCVLCPVSNVATPYGVQSRPSHTGQKRPWL